MDSFGNGLCGMDDQRFFPLKKPPQKVLKAKNHPSNKISRNESSYDIRIKMEREGSRSFSFFGLFLEEQNILSQGTKKKKCIFLGTWLEVKENKERIL